MASIYQRNFCDKVTAKNRNFLAKRVDPCERWFETKSVIIQFKSRHDSCWSSARSEVSNEKRIRELR